MGPFLARSASSLHACRGSPARSPRLPLAQLCPLDPHVPAAQWPGSAAVAVCPSPYTSPLHSAVVHGTGPKSPRSLQRSHVAPRRSPSLPSGGAVSSSHAGLGAGLIARGPGFKAPQVPRGPAVQAEAVRRQADANRVGATDSRAGRLGVVGAVRERSVAPDVETSKLSPRLRVYPRRAECRGACGRPSQWRAKRGGKASGERGVTAVFRIARSLNRSGPAI